jgi:hypothetical protein
MTHLYGTLGQPKRMAVLPLLTVWRTFLIANSSL